VPMRRKFAISAPAILSRLHPHNRSKSYDHRIKPYGFVQTIRPAVIGSSEPPPIAQFEKGLGQIETPAMDWPGNSMADTVPVTRLSE